ncbi:MAG: TonB-dependent receptor plug domain-containing protein, partial [Pseudomonadales bacterium]|nr:TonB-dependent receptor plug domain-containing protein [Pseudomonadales bacterium]
MLIPYQKSTIAMAIAISLSSHAALAQEESSSENSLSLEEVVVTAQKREQNMQDVPVAITAFNADAIRDRKIDDITDIGSTTPNVQIAPSPGGSTGATVAIRGAASINPAATWEPSVGIYMDGVFIAKNVGGIFDVAELSAIEILRGPQGTLYGKNTTGGAINLVTRKPAEEFGGRMKVGAGNFGYTEFSAAVDSGKIADIASFMVSYSKRDRDGFYDNVDPNNTGTYLIDEFKKLDSEAGLLKANFDVSDTVEINYSYDFSKRDNTVAFGQGEFLAADGQLPAPKRLDEGSVSGAGHDQSESSGHSIHVLWDITEDMMFKSITAYREMTFSDHNDYDGTPAGIPVPSFEADRDVDQDQTSQ